MPTIRLNNACVIQAMRDLLGNPRWESERVTYLIAFYGGYPSNRVQALEEVAPVRVINYGQIEVGETVVTVKSVAGEYFLSKNEKVIVIYGKSHAVCIRAGEIDSDTAVLIILSRKNLRK